jgi:prolyl-tRNA synthetase
VASIIEEHHDEGGIVWPMTVAPYQVVIVPVKYDGAVKTASCRLAADLEAQGIEVLLDDRDERPGVKFNDADLTGIPYRVVIGDKNLVRNEVEVKRRGQKESRLIGLAKAAEELTGLVYGELKELNR